MLVSCGASAAGLPDAGATAHVERRPPGIALDMSGGTPDARRSVRADASLATLMTPESAHFAERVVERFFDAVANEVPSGLDAVVSPSCLLRTSLKSPTRLASELWRRRLDTLDYRALAGRPVFRPRDLESYTFDELAAIRPQRNFQLQPRKGMRLVRVRILVPQAGRQRLFGDEIEFLIGPGPNGGRIEEMFEEINLP